jgi:hypothetical protein
VQNQALFTFFDLGLRIDSQGEVEAEPECPAEIVQAPESLPELRVKCPPADGGWRLQDVKAVCKPAIDIQGQAIVGNLAYGCLGDRYGMALELIEEGLSQDGFLKDAGSSFSTAVCIEHGLVEDELVDQPGSSTLEGLEA